MENVGTFIVLLIGAVLAFALVRRLEPQERRWAMLGFAARAVGGGLYWFILHYVQGANDADGYFASGTELARLMDYDFARFVPEVAKLFVQIETRLPFEVMGDGHSTGSMAAIAAACIFVAGSGTLTIYVVAGFFSWLGALQLYRFAREQVPIETRGLALVGCFAIPSVVFWSSGFCKEAFVIGFLGMLVLSTYRLLLQRRLWHVIGVLLGGSGVALLKPYTLFAYFFALAAFVYVEAIRSSQARVVVRPVYLFAACAIAAGGVAAMGALFPQFGADHVFTTISEQQETLQQFSQTAAAGGSDIEIGSGAARTGWEQLRFVPIAAVNAFFRPAFFEARNGVQFGAALENTALTIAILQVLVGWRRAQLGAVVRRSSFFMSSVAFAVVFGTGVGLATGNLGTLSRYRAPMMPFVVITVLALRREAQGRAVAVQERARKPARIARV